MSAAPTAPLALALALDPDPGWLAGSLTECGACHQPIAVPRDAEATACSHCGAAHTASPRVAPSDAPDLDDRSLFDLRKVPAGLEDLGERPGAPRLPALRRAWEDTKSALLVPHHAADEFRAAWLAATLGRIYGATGDRVRERAVLEASLERLAVDAYRALSLARLARAAAFAGHLDLADHWLSQARSNVGVTEVDDDILVARALLLLKSERFDEVIALLGADDERATFAALVRPFADLVRIDALERSGRGYPAYVLYRKALRAHGTLPLQALVLYYRLGLKTRRWILFTGFAALVVIAALLVVAWRLATE